LQLAENGSRPAASVPYRLQIGIKSNCLAVIPRRTIVLTFFQVGFRTVGEGFAVVGFEPNCLIESFDGEVVFAFLQVSHAAVIEGLGGSSIELDRLIEIPDRALV